jgi:hypothetical protein
MHQCLAAPLVCPTPSLFRSCRSCSHQGASSAPLFLPRYIIVCTFQVDLLPAHVFLDLLPPLLQLPVDVVPVSVFATSAKANSQVSDVCYSSRHLSHASGASFVSRYCVQCPPPPSNPLFSALFPSTQCSHYRPPQSSCTCCPPTSITVSVSISP